MTRLVTLMWIARLVLAGVMIPHGLGKFISMSAFMAKFDLGMTITVLTGIAELAGAAGVLLGGLRSPPAWLTNLATWLGVLAIATVQVGAIVYDHWGRFFYFLGGVEYNLVLLALCLIVLLGQPYPRATVRGKPG